MKKLLLFLTVLFCGLISINKSIYGQVDLYLNDINVYVDGYGKIGIYTLPDTIKQISRATILVGTGPDAVFDYYEDVDAEEPTTLLDNPTFGDYEIYGSYNNNYSGYPPNVLEKLNIYCWQDQNSIIVKYTIISREVDAVDAIVGLDLVPQVEDSYSGGDTVTYSSQNKVISVRKTEAVGFRSLSEDFKSIANFLWFDGYNEDSAYYNWLTYNDIDSLFITDPDDPNVDDPVIIPAFSEQTVAPGDSLIYYVAIAYGLNEADMQTSMQQAVDKYGLLTSVENDETLPSVFSLNQNYPNPFNPSTKISYQVPQKGLVTLKVYNVLGKEVTTLVNEEKPAGFYSIDFDARGLSSGVYFYSIQYGSSIQTKKMTLLK